MPKGPQGQKRPADAIARAIMVGRIATGEIDDPTDADGKDAAAVELGRKGGRKGGKARAASLTADERAAQAKKASDARWNQKSTENR